MSSNNAEAAPQRPKDAQPTAGTNDLGEEEGKKLSSRGPSAKRGEIKEKILNEKNPESLNEWLKAAAKADSIEEFLTKI